MRITGGTLCGRKIECPGGIIRPAMDRMRESVFAILGDLSGKSFLDVFSGSGSISLEAVSRGATRVTLVEGDKKKASIVLKNVQISPVRIECKFIPAERFLLRCKDQFDFIFFDPPFPYGFHRRLLESTVENNLLKETGTLMIHRPSELRDLDDPIEGLTKIDQRVYGRSIVDFFKNAN